MIGYVASVLSSMCTSFNSLCGGVSLDVGVADKTDIQ